MFSNHHIVVSPQLADDAIDDFERQLAESAAEAGVR
jgi:hypothetical protein